jgi:hypothetical protein
MRQRVAAHGQMAELRQSTVVAVVVLAGLRLHNPLMELLTLFGLFAVTAMLITYACEERSPSFILGFAIACALGSVYGFLQGAWPFGVVEAIWAVVALRRWWSRRTHADQDRKISA